MKYYFKCPKCGQDDAFYRIEESDDGAGCLLLLFGGFIPYLLFQSYRQGRVQCEGCGYLFKQPTLTTSWSARIGILLLCLSGVVPIFLLVLASTPEFERKLPGNTVTWQLEGYIREHTLTVVYAAGIFYAFLISGLIAMVILSNRLWREYLSHYYRLDPQSRPMQPAGTDEVQTRFPEEP